MAKFSDRLGITQPPKEIQVDSMNDDLRNSLWNWTYSILIDTSSSSLLIIGRDYFKRPVHSLDRSQSGISRWFLQEFTSCEWYEVYNLVEVIFQSVSFAKRKDPEGKGLNFILERELSAYRLIGAEIAPIADKHEIESIRTAMVPSSLELEGAAQHIAKSLSLMSKKPDPDYANSIKESISAVESICKVLTSEKSGGLDKALNELASKTEIHPALKKALSGLYGYTSDEDGIRHAILETKNIGFAEAKFMLVTCSAFVNFIVDKARGELI